MNPRAIPAALILGLLAVIVLAPLAGLLNLGSMPGYESGDLRFWQSGYIRRVLYFSLWQALLSTLCSVLPAILVARAFALQPAFPLRSLLLRLFALPLVVPAVVAVMGVVSVYGSDGWIPLGRSLYGLGGILLAHVFFNLPLAVRLLLPHWQATPSAHWQLAEQLGMNAWQRWRYLEWPALREGLPGVMLLIFMLCLTSFAVVLTVILALLQLVLCLLVAGLTLKLHRLPEVEITIDAPTQPTAPAVKPLQLVLILLASVYVAMPLLSMLLDALSGPLAAVLAHAGLWRSLLNTLFIGLSAALCAVETAGRG
jgi:thiamine transport system permease protein